MEMQYMKQPTEYLCGQACVAMLYKWHLIFACQLFCKSAVYQIYCAELIAKYIANVSVDEVIEVIHNDRGTGKKELAIALGHFGISCAKTMTKADNDTKLPDTCILKVLLSKYGHWVLYHEGKYYAPGFGLLDELYPKERIQS